MKNLIELDEKDIAQIIANAYDCDIKDVSMKVKHTWEGYGPMERPVPRCSATITINREGKHTNA